MIGIVLRRPAGGNYVKALQERGGILVNTAGNRVIRLLPPLIIEGGTRWRKQGKR
ncbi:hypothetical protein [Thermococcus sp. JCM 11816]|uniref:hypothetical protein n=1 Tax=Thermococcus sp. (strain JCM 11816 / KS-1) TaxID=1295125 RepID=UPI000A808075